MPTDKATQDLVDKAKREMDAARAELRERIKAIETARQKERDEYQELALYNTLPAWAVKQVLTKNRGWICRLFGVRIDHWHYSKHAEQFMVFKRNKIVMTKIFKWDDGRHMEGKR